MDLFERFFEIYPKHARFAQAIEKMAYIYLQNERYQRSRELFNKLSKLEIETETRISTNKSLAKISLLENEPSKALQNELNKTTKDYRSYTIAQKKEALNKIALIGKIALPWLRKMYSEDVLSEYITCVAKMNAPSGIPLLFDILHKKKNYDDKILIAILKIGIPATEMDSILNNEFDSFSKDRKVKLQKHFQDIFWGAPTSVLEKSPNFIKYINGNAKEQHLAIEEINLHLGSKQIPILQKLALQGKDETVKVHALENLLLWKDEKTYPFVKKMLPKASSNMRYLVLKNFYSIKYYEIENLEQMFTDQDSKVRNEALKILPFSNISDKIRLLVYLLDDKDYKIRNKARKLLLQSQDPKTNLILAKGLAKETNNIQYYAYVTGILRTRTKFELLNSYTPRMNSQQRIELMEELISKLK